MAEAELAENARSEWSGMSVLLDKLYSDIINDVGRIVDEIRGETTIENDLNSAQRKFSFIKRVLIISSLGGLLIIDLSLIYLQVRNDLTFLSTTDTIDPSSRDLMFLVLNLYDSQST